MSSIVRMHATMALLGALALSGCSSGFYDERVKGFTPELPEATYPIDVVKGAVRLKLSARASGLTAEETDAVRRLGSAASSQSSPVFIHRPAGSLNAEVKAAKIARILTEMGVETARIHHAARAGTGEILVTYRRKFAVTKSCENMWSRPSNETAANRPMPGFGCSQQHNLAAMVDNPEDFAAPRVMPPPDTDSRIEAVRKFRKREDFNSAASAQSKISVKDAKSE